MKSTGARKCAYCGAVIPEMLNVNNKYCSATCKKEMDKLKAREIYKERKEYILERNKRNRNTDKAREWRKEYKRKKRRENGVISLEERRQLRALVAQTKEKSRVRHRYGDADFHGPPPPFIVLSDAQHYYWRYNNDSDFRNKEIERTRKRKAELHESYLAYLMKMRKNECTNELIELKREQLKLKRLTVNLKKELNRE